MLHTFLRQLFQSVFVQSGTKMAFSDFQAARTLFTALFGVLFLLGTRIITTGGILEYGQGH